MATEIHIKEITKPLKQICCGLQLRENENKANSGSLVAAQIPSLFDDETLFKSEGFRQPRERKTIVDWLLQKKKKNTNGSK